MSIAEGGGPHTFLIFRRVTTFSANNSPKHEYQFVKEFRGFVQPIGSEEIQKFAKQGIEVNSMITMFSDPGEIDEKTVVQFDNRGYRETHECRGFFDECNLGRVFVMLTSSKSSKLSTQVYASGFSVSGTSSVSFVGSP